MVSSALEERIRLIKTRDAQLHHLIAPSIWASEMLLEGYAPHWQVPRYGVRRIRSASVHASNHCHATYTAITK